MAISYVGGKGAGSAGQGGGSISLTTGWSGGSGGNPLEGDLVVVTVSVGTAGRTPTIEIATPTGYTPLTVQRTSATTYDTNVQTCYKIMGSTPDTTVTIPASGNNQDAITYTIHVFRGVDPTTVEDTTPTYATGSGTSTKCDPATITPVTAGAWIYYGGGGAAGLTAVYTASYLSDFLSFVGADTNDAAVGSGYYTGWSSGAYDGAAFTGGTNGAQASWGCTTLALRPLANAGVGTSAGTSTVSGVGASTGAGVGTAAGTSTPTGVGTGLVASVASDAGTSTASGVGASTAEGVGTSAGTGAASGVGAATAAGIGSSDGLATAAGVGSASGGGPLTGFLQLEDGTGNITNEALIDPILDTDGIALRDVNGEKIYDADNTLAAGYFILEGGAVIAEPGEVYAWSAASGVGHALIDDSAGTATGTSTASGVGFAFTIAAGVGTASGTSTASGVGSAGETVITAPTRSGRGGGGGSGRKKDREYTGSAKLSNPVTEAEIEAAYNEVMGIKPAPVAQPTQKPAQRQDTTRQAQLTEAAIKAAADALAREQDEEDALIALLLVA